MSAPEINRVTHAQIVTDHTVELQFGDGFVGRVDLSPALWGPVFEPLHDPEYFRRLRIEDDTIRWPNGSDFCPDVLRYWCEAGSVRSQAETDSHFARPVAAPAAS